MTVEQLMLDLAAEKANNQKAEVNFLIETSIYMRMLMLMSSRPYVVILNDKIENYVKNLKKMKNSVKENQERCLEHWKRKFMHLKNNLMVKFGMKN
jgi:hypothetical protein